MKIYPSLFCSLLLAACGRYGSPIPPESLAPDSVINPALYGRANGVEVSWTQPIQDGRGQSLQDLELYRVLRAELGTEEQVPQAEEIATLPARLSEDGTPTKEIIRYFDESAELGKSYQYVVIPVADDDLQGRAKSVALFFNGEQSALIPTVSVGGFFGF